MKNLKQERYPEDDASYKSLTDSTMSDADNAELSRLEALLRNAEDNIRRRNVQKAIEDVERRARALGLR